MSKKWTQDFFKRGIQQMVKESDEFEHHHDRIEKSILTFREEMKSRSNRRFNRNKQRWAKR